MKIFELFKNWYLKTFKAEEIDIVSKDKIIEEEDNRDYYVGASPLKWRVILPGGQWYKTFTPKAEIQKGLFESMGCTLFSLLNSFEFLAFYKWNEIWNKSDRYSNAVCKTSDRGNSPKLVVDLTRNVYGCVDEEVWPVDWKTMRKEEYRKWPSSDVINQGKDWLKFYEVNYERVNQTPQQMMSALEYSPLWVNGCAWILSGGLYRSWGNINHQFLIVGYEEGKCWYAFDSYPPYIKKLAWDYNFGVIRKIKLDKKNFEFNKEGLKDLMEKRGWKYIVLNEAYESFDPGCYRLKEDSVELVPFQEAIKIGIIKLKEDGELEGISKKDFARILIK